ncbi:MAG TPA: PDZ domain-containing protein [Acidobacteriaceae bacterium]|jgi:membrane-associated protease RseP (regulator of RpoE activity)|nr:PDZ domain-containing protein [Acidobacteriaceae bacterium]
MRTGFRVRQGRAYVIALAAIIGGFVCTLPGSAYAQTAQAAYTTPSTTGSAAPSVSYVGKRLAIKVLPACPADFNPANPEVPCDRAEVDKIKSWIESFLTDHRAVAGIGDDSPDIVVTVTLIKATDDTGIAGFLTDLAPGHVELQANYQIADAAGHVLQTGTVSHTGSDYDDFDKLEQQYASKIAAAIAASPATGAPAEAVASLAQLAGAPVVHAGNPAPRLRFGIKMSELAPSAGAQLGHPGLTGAFVVNYVLGSPAAKAGIRAGDVIYEFDGKPVASAKNLVAAIAAEPAGKAVPVKLLRGKQDISVVVQF